MFRHHPFTRFGAMLLVLALVSNSVLPVAHAQSTTPLYLPIITNGNAAPQTDLVFRTHITVQTPAQWRDLQRMEVVILEQGADWATVLVDDLQLTDLARWRFMPDQTNALQTLAANDVNLRTAVLNLLGQLELFNTQIRSAGANADDARSELRAQLQALTDEQLVQVAQAAIVDTDNDGLTDDQEFFWCTNANRIDSDFDGTKDGEEVIILKQWLNNYDLNRLLSKQPNTGRPFLGWPVSPTSTTCADGDQDGVPDLAEQELGLSPNRESTDRDKFDDGQELFGTTYCTGTGGYCSYGMLPRSADWGVIFAEMPAWVKAPGNHPLVAAYPVPEVNIMESSLKVQIVTTITDGETTLTGVETSHTTAKTNGTSTSKSETETWNKWMETTVSKTSPSNSSLVQSSSMLQSYGDLDSILEGEVQFDATGQVCGAAAVSASGSILGFSGAGSASNCNNVKVDFSPETDFSLFKDVQINVPEINLPEFNFSNWFNNASLDITLPKIDCLVNCSNNTVVNNTTQLASQMASVANTQNKRGAPSQSQYAFYQSTSGNAGNALYQHRYYPASFPLSQPQTTTSTTNGSSTGGARSTTNTTYEEHTITDGEAFLSQESWSKTTAVDSRHAADLWFSYKVRNTGTEFAHEICNLTFNVYLNDELIYTYFVPSDRSGQCFASFDPGEEHTFSARTNTHAIPLTLEQLKAIEVAPDCEQLRAEGKVQPYDQGGRCFGGKLRITVEDFSYGIDEQFYKEAAGAGIMVMIEDGSEDGNELLDTFLVPTWRQEKALHVVARYFPHRTDAKGNLIALWTPEYGYTRSNTPVWCKEAYRPIDYPDGVVWCKHQISTADWWNIYTNGLGDGSKGFQDTDAIPGTVALLRFNKDADFDGFSDRSEAQLGTDANDAASFPKSEVVAGIHRKKSGNNVVATLSLLNSGVYDAYGVEAVMVAPDDSVTITNNTIGGSGRVRALKQIIVGSALVLQTPLSTPWGQANYATPGIGGYYSGVQDRTYTFTVVDCPVGECRVGSGTWKLDWNDGQGANGQLNFGESYKSPIFLPVGTLGLTLALYSGNVINNKSFTVNARTPRDTFQYTINREPYTEPLVIVSYNDPQGNHRFVLPSQAMSLTTPTANLQQFAGTMLDDVGVEIVTSRPFTVGVNSATLLVNNPSAKTLQNARLFLEVINISGTVVSEVPTQVNLPPGPTAVPVSFNTGSFNPTYRAADDYIVMAFLTDYQGNILDTAGRPLSSFQVDPLPELAADDATLSWNIGTVTQGTLLKHALALANTGFGRLYTYIPPTSGLALNTIGSRTVGAADQPLYELTLRTADLPVGLYDQTITLATSDPAQPTRSLRVYGAITAASGDTSGGVLQRPLDFAVTVPGSHSQGEWVDFTHNLGPEPQKLHPVKVYNQNYGKVWGNGKYATSLGSFMDSINVGLVGNWNFDNGVASDTSGNNNNGTIVGATAVGGVKNSALNFDGNDFVKIPKSATLNNLQQATIAYWVKYFKPTSGSDDVSTTIANGPDAVAELGFFTYALHNGIIHYLGQWGNGIPALVPFDATQTLNQQDFMFVTVVVTDSQIRAYKNGELQQETARNNFPIARPSQDWYLGQSGSTDFPYFLTGIMDEVRIYNRALSAEEVNALYRTIKYPFITEQVESAPHTAARLNLPETFNNGRTYNVQFGHKLDFNALGEQVATLRVPAGLVANSTLDVLVNNASTGNLTLKLDIGNNGSWDWESTQNVTNAATFSSSDLSAAFNQYWIGHGSATTGHIEIPVKLWLSKAATAFVTNLQQLNLTATGTGAALDPSPLDVTAAITGSHTAGEWVQFTHNLGPEAQSLHPVTVYSQDYTERYGVGKYNLAAPPVDTGWIPLLQNGGFESGNTTGWQVTDGSAWEAATGARDTGWISRLQNGGFETGNFNNWSVGPGSWIVEQFDMNASRCNTCPYSVAKKGGTNPGWIAQEVDISQYRSLLDLGAGYVDAYGHVRTQDGGDKGRVVIQYKAGGTVLATYDSGYRAPGYTWERLQDSRQIPAGTDRIRFEFWLDTDGDGDCKIDSGVVNIRMNYSDPAHAGAYKIRRTSGSNPGSIYQDISLAAWQELIKRGTGTINVGAWLKSIDTNDQLRIQSSFFQSNQVIPNTGYDSGWVRPADWLQYQSEQPIPVGADSVRITLSSTGDADAVFDDVVADVRFRYHIAEQIESEPYTSGNLNLPESFTDGRTYKVQFGRKLDFTAAGSQVTALRVPAGLYNSVQLDALVSGLPANATLSLDVGNNGSTEWSGAVVNNSTNVSGDLAAAFTAYWRSQNSPSGGTLDVPIKVTTTQPGQILLTNLQVSATGSRLRYVRVPVANYTRFLLDFTAGNGGTVALDLGDNGSIDWSTSLAAPRQLTENLNDELNAYLAGKSGNVDVPVRFYLAPLHPITLNDYQATVASTLDLIANSITVGNGVVTAAGADSILIDADSTATVQATLRNNSSSASGPVTAAFFATATGWGDWYIGSAFVANIAATSNVTVTIPWNTTGFSGTVPVKVVINPYQRVAETNYNNNRKETIVIVPLPPVLPAPPTNLVGTMAATNRINLTWADASSNESGFKIERSPDGINGWTQIATVNAGVTTYASTGLACGKAYFYRVRAYNGNGDSAFSNVATALTRLCPPALQPLTGITQTQLTLVWSDNNSNEGGFKIERSATGATPWSQIATVGANVTTYINSGLQCGTPYYYRVRAYNGSNNSAYSAIVNATTTICSPAAPTLLAATAISATQINLSWQDNSTNESGFKMERSPDGVNGWTLLTTVGAGVTSYSDSGLACATAYHYRVRATNAGGDSPNSNVANATTPTCLPDLIFADSFESGNLLTWSARAIGGGDLRVNGAAKLVGNWGMEANINDAIAIYVTDDRPNAETRYRARFYFDPNSITMTSGDAHFIFYGFHNTAVVLRVEFRRLNSSYQVRVATLNDAPTTGAATWRTTSYVTISDAPHSLEIDWQAATAPGANNGSLTFWIDGVQRPPLTGLDNDTRRIDIARLGPIGGIDVGTRGAYYFDAFESRRRSYIGPVAGSALAAEVLAPAEPLTTTTGNSVATANLSAETATTLTADVGGLGATVTFPASASQEALIAQLVLTDTQTAPDGYALLGEMMTVQSSAPVTQPVTVSVHYGLMAATVTPTATLTLQRWNGDASQWEVLPAQVNAEAQTVTAAINGPAIFALWQQEIEQTGKESSEQMEGGGYFLYLPLVEE